MSEEQQKGALEKMGWWEQAGLDLGNDGNETDMEVETDMEMETDTEMKEER